MYKYFDKHINDDQCCEVFCIEGVPACSMIYHKTNIYKQPNVDAFYINKGMILLFDAGQKMRKKLYCKYPRISMNNATNRNDFLLF